MEESPDILEEKLSPKISRLGRYKGIRVSLFLGAALGAAVYILCESAGAKYLGFATAGSGVVAAAVYKKKINELEKKIEEDRRTLRLGGIIKDD